MVFSESPNAESIAFEIVREKWQAYSGQATIPAFFPLDVVAEILGYSTGSARNQICQRRFEIPTTKIGGRRVVTSPALLQYLVAKFSGSASLGLSGVRVKKATTRRGRPNAAERAEAERLGLTVAELRAVRAGGEA